MEKSEIETKAAGHEVGEAFDEFMRVFEAFKETNDERLAEIERRCAADVVTTDKLARIDRALDENKRVVDELALKAARPPLGGGATPRSGASLAHKAAFDGYVRRGEAGQLRALEGKALSVGSDPDGGYLVPDETERAVNRSLRDVSPIRAIAGLRQVSSAVYKKPFSLTGPGTGWVGETAARPETTTPTLAELSFPTMELYAMPAATPALLEDSAVSIDEWLAEEVRLAFAVQEARRSWPATESTSRAASSTTRRWRTPPGRGATSATSPRERPAPFRPAPRATS
jgi:HK97 family phage major capsid protein